jgi:hypothetical protein
MIQEYLRHGVISTTMGEYVGEVDSVRGEATEIIARQPGLSLEDVSQAIVVIREEGN